MADLRNQAKRIKSELCSCLDEGIQGVGQIMLAPQDPLYFNDYSIVFSWELISESTSASIISSKTIYEIMTNR